MKVLELFSGTECMSNAFRARGHECFTVDFDEQFPSSLHIDIMDLTADMVREKFGQPDIVWIGTDCFPAGNIVWTSEGYKNIEDVQCNDYVLTHSGKYQRVIKTMKTNKYDFYDIKIAGCESFLVSSRHPFYVRKKHSISTHVKGESIRKSWMDAPEWKRVEDLTTDYKVGVRINQNAIIPKWNGTVYYRRNSYGITGSWVENKLAPLMENEDFWWFVGRYMGDGYITKPTPEKKQIHDIDLSCATTLKEDVFPIIDRLGFKYRFRSQGSTSHFAISDKELWEFLSQFGYGALNKTITPAILDLPIPLLRKFIEGYLSADGHYDKSQNQWKFTTISKGLAYGMEQCILKAYGNWCNVVTRDDNTNIIQGRLVNVHKAYQLAFVNGNNPKRSQYKIEDGICWINIKKIEKQKSKQTTCYNMSVENDESYTVNNVIVHNCTTYSVAAIGFHRRADRVTGNLVPKTEKAKRADALNRHVLDMLKDLNPKFFFIENPVGALRKMDFMHGIPRYTITYCAYGFRYRKATDIWTNHPDPKFKPACHNGDPCHEAAPRGTKLGLQAIDNAVDRARYPQELCEHIVDICERDFDKPAKECRYNMTITCNDLFEI